MRGKSGMSKLFQKFGKKATRETAAANNIDYEQLIVSFLKNKISYDQIMEIIRTDDGFLDYLQELIKDDTDYPQEVRENRDALRAELCHIGSVLQHPTLIYHIMLFAIRPKHPELKFNDPNDAQSSLLYDCVPMYLFGTEAVRFAEDLLLNNEEVRAFSKTKKIKYCKEKLREYYHIEGRHYPHWVQDAEWPFRDGKPMRFIGQKTDGELVTYTFLDDETGEVERVEQYW